MSLLFLPALCSAAGQPPKLRLSEVENILPVGYRVALTLDPDKDSFTGSIDMKVDVRKPVKTIWLNANQINVEEASLSASGKTMPAKAVPGGDDLIGLEFESDVPVGAAEIRIRYVGVVRQGDSSGVFRAEDLGEHYILTQFESTDARDAFPCFDEPSYKVPWQLTLHIPAQDKAVSNTPVASETSEGGTSTYVFRETKPLPSYLVAFGVGPFEFVDAGFAGKNHFPVRIVTPKGRASEARYAAEVTATILTRLEEYFGVPYPYEKSDQVAVPVTTGFGAMETAGMVTYGQTIILAKAESDTISRQRGYASIAAHELAHQWVGDLVTMEWWNDIWLNEAFATWMDQKLIAEWKPEWNTRVEDVDSKLFAEEQDSLTTARRIRQPIESKSDIGDAFDAITYQKGAAVIGMFESWMGPDEFRKGVQTYLRRYAFKNATAADFLDALSPEDGKGIREAFSTFLDQPGVPVIAVGLDCRQSTPTAQLEQARFLPLGSKGSAAQVWSVPVCARFGARTESQRECTLLTKPRMAWALKTAKSCPTWIDADAQAKGYYRVDYRDGLLSALTSSDVIGRLGAAERVDLIGNAQAMERAGKLPAATALGLVEVFSSDAEREVIQQALDLALAPRRDMVPPALEPNYQRFLLKYFQPRARELGWVPRPGESDDVRLLRPGLLRAVATYGGDERLANQAQELAEQWLGNHAAVKPEVLGAVLTTAAYYGNVALFDRFLAEFEKTQDLQDKPRLLGAMTSFRNRSAIEAGMNAALSGKISLVDGFSLLLGAGQNYAETRKMPFEFLKAHFDQIMKSNPSIFGFDLGSFLPQVGASFCDTASRTELQGYFEPLVSKYSGVSRALSRVVERIDLCIAHKAAQEASVADFLRKY